LVVLPLGPPWALSRVLRSDQCREIWEQVQQLALVLVWSQGVPLEQVMLVPLVAHCK
jgi:hypothetical protein